MKVKWNILKSTAEYDCLYSSDLKENTIVESVYVVGLGNYLQYSYKKKNWLDPYHLNLLRLKIILL